MVHFSLKDKDDKSRWYNLAMNELSGVHRYRPELIPRRGEIVAWTCAGMALLAAAILRFGGYAVPWGLTALLVLFLGSALLISLGNFVDQHTQLTISPEGVSFENGLRKVKVAWEDVREVRVFPSRMGDKVQVFDAKSYFQFRTLGEVHMHGELKGRMGFAQGDSILRTLILQAGLRIVDRAGEGYYYARG